MKRQAYPLHIAIKLPSVDKVQYACQRLKSTLASSSSLAGASPPASSSSPAPIFPRWQVLRSFSGADLVADKADEAAGLVPGNENNEASRRRCPEKPCCPLSTEGIFEGEVKILFCLANERTHFYTTSGVSYNVRFCAAPKPPWLDKSRSLSEIDTYYNKPTYDRNHRSV